MKQSHKNLEGKHIRAMLKPRAQNTKQLLVSENFPNWWAQILLDVSKGPFLKLSDHYPQVNWFPPASEEISTHTWILPDPNPPSGGTLLAAWVPVPPGPLFRRQQSCWATWGTDRAREVPGHHTQHFKSYTETKRVAGKVNTEHGS